MGCGDSGGGGTLSCGIDVLARRQVVCSSQLPPHPRACGWDPCCRWSPGSILSPLETGDAGESHPGCQVNVLVQNAAFL